MSTANAGTFACESCGKSYRWRPDFAGKKLKCGCGNVMQPTSPPTVADVPEAPLQEAPRRAACPECSSPITPGAVLCVNCGFNLQAGTKVQTQIDAGAPKTGKTKKKKSAAAKPAAKTPVLDSLGRRLLADDPEEVAARARWDDIYWPTAAIVVGLGLNFLDARWAQQIDDWKYAVTYVMLISALQVFISFIAVLITAKLLSIGLGTIPIALLKVTGVALAPGAISSIITTKIPMGWTLAWFLSLILYYVLFNKFFDMDFQEMLICAALIWVTRTWIAYFLVMMILTNWMGFRSAIWDSGDYSDDDETPSKHVKPNKTPGKMKQKAPKADDSDEGALIFPIGDKAMAVFFDPVREETYHLGAVPA